MRFMSIVCCAALLAAAACGSGKDETPRTGEADVAQDGVGSGGRVAAGSSPGSAGAGDSDGSSRGIVLPCGGMTVAAAAGILETAEEEVQYTFSEEMGRCRYSAGLAKSISYAVYAEENAAAAVVEMAKVADGLGTLADCGEVAGLGDDAVYCGGERAERLLVRQGAGWIDILAPGGLGRMTRVAESVLE